MGGSTWHRFSIGSTLCSQYVEVAKSVNLEVELILSTCADTCCLYIGIAGLFL